MILRALSIALLSLFWVNAQALVLTATPLETEAEAKELYQPVADLLSEKLGQEVIFEYSVDWLTFSKHIIASDYDLILSEPHIVAYVTSKTSVLSMDAIAKLPGTQKFHVIVSADSEFSDIKQLESQSICMLPSPNFSGVMIMKEFKNPVTQPLVVEVRGDYDEVYAKFRKNRCTAAVIDDASFQRISTVDENIQSIYTTISSPNLGLAVSQRLPHADRKLVEEVLTDPEVIAAFEKLFLKYSNGKGPFEEADNNNFSKFNILPGVVWGW